MTHLVVGDQLVDVVLGKPLLEVAWHCYEVEVGLHRLGNHFSFCGLGFYGLHAHTIGWVLELKVSEVVLNVSEVFDVAKGEVVDLVREIKIVALPLKHRFDVAITMGSDVEVSRHSVNFEGSLELAALFLVEFGLHSLEYRPSEIVFLGERLRADDFSILVQPIFP